MTPGPEQYDAHRSEGQRQQGRRREVSKGHTGDANDQIDACPGDQSDRQQASENASRPNVRGRHDRGDEDAAACDQERDDPGRHYGSWGRVDAGSIVFASAHSRSRASKSRSRNAAPRSAARRSTRPNRRRNLSFAARRAASDSIPSLRPTLTTTSSRSPNSS